jgi:hypothetical protein
MEEKMAVVKGEDKKRGERVVNNPEREVGFIRITLKIQKSSKKQNPPLFLKLFE